MGNMFEVGDHTFDVDVLSTPACARRVVKCSRHGSPPNTASVVATALAAGIRGSHRSVRTLCFFTIPHL